MKIGKKDGNCGAIDCLLVGAGVLLALVCSLWAYESAIRVQIGTSNAVNLHSGLAVGSFNAVNHTNAMVIGENVTSIGPDSVAVGEGSVAVDGGAFAVFRTDEFGQVESVLEICHDGAVRIPVEDTDPDIPVYEDPSL